MKDIAKLIEAKNMWMGISLLLMFFVATLLYHDNIQDTESKKLCLERNKFAVNLNYLNSKIAYSEANLKQAELDLGNQSMIYTSIAMLNCTR